MKKKNKKQKKDITDYNIADYREYLPYCCNLDEYEYGLLWECYEEVTIFDRLKSFIKRIFYA